VFSYVALYRNPRFGAFGPRIVRGFLQFPMF
jgi:hypothetical protein